MTSRFSRYYWNREIAFSAVSRELLSVRLTLKWINIGFRVNETYVNNPIFWRMSVRSTDVETISLSHWLYHSNVISTIEMLKTNNFFNLVKFFCISS